MEDIKPKRPRIGLGFKMALLCSLGLFIVLSLLFHVSFNRAEENLLGIIKSSDQISLYYAESIKKTLFDNRVLFIASTLLSILVSVLVVMFFFNRLAKTPLNHLINTIEEVERGNLDAMAPVKGSDEIAILSEKFNRMIKAVKGFQKRVIEEYIHEKIAIVDSISAGVIIVDYDKKVLFANHAALKMLRVKLEDFLEEEFPYPITPGIIKEFQLNAPGALPAIMEMRFMSIDWQKSPAYLVLLIDVTRLKTAERELREAKEKAEAATVAKSLFLANMSHEIRTPMNAIMGMTDIVLSTNLSEEQRGYLKTIKTASESLLSILNDILDLSKIESGKLELDKIPFHLEGIIDETLSLFFNQALSKGLYLHREIDEDVPLPLKGDPLRVRQVLYNLLSNAIKFTEKGEIAIIVKKVKSGKTDNAYPYHLSTKETCQNKVMLLFCVKDTGIGIPYALQEKVFDSFTQADGSITRRYGGTGLGLTICREIVRLMKGSIWVESELGKGSSFYFTALFEEEKGTSSSELGCQRDTLTSDIQPLTALNPNMKLLVAEDDRLNQQILSLFLQKQGIDFTLVENGRQAIAKLEQEHFDMILMDLQMPDMDGLEATRIIRASNSGMYDPKIPIIAVTAFALKEDVQKCFEAGMDEYISKPIKADRLIEVIHKLAKDRGISAPV